MAGRLRQGRAPTRRFHVPSAVRGSAARIDAATARELVANEPLLVDVRRKAESDGSSCEKSRPPNARLSVLGILATRGIGAVPPRARAANRITRLVRASGGSRDAIRRNGGSAKRRRGNLVVRSARVEVRNCRGLAVIRLRPDRCGRSGLCVDERRFVMYAAIDIDKRAFQAAVLDPDSGQVVEQLRDRTRLRKALAEDRRRWGQRLHAFLLHEGWPCSKSNLLRPPGLRWAAALRLPEHARLQVDSLLSVMAALEAQLETVDAELRRFARQDERCQALQTIYGIGPILAATARRPRRGDPLGRGTPRSPPRTAVPPPGNTGHSPALLGAARVAFRRKGGNLLESSRA